MGASSTGLGELFTGELDLDRLDTWISTLLQERGLFRLDGLSRLGEAKERQGFNRGDRQTYAGGWEASEGDSAARRLLAAKLAALRREASVALRRPSMGRAGAVADERSHRQCRNQSVATRLRDGVAVGFSHRSIRMHPTH